jgi:hypothetical protein
MKGNGQMADVDIIDPMELWLALEFMRSPQ